jgi:hypothetical protein
MIFISNTENERSFIEAQAVAGKVESTPMFSRYLDFENYELMVYKF